MKTCLLYLHPCHRPFTQVLLHHHHHHRKQPHWNLSPEFLLSSSSSSTVTGCNHLLLQALHICRSRRWDSNAESFRTQNFNYNFDDDDDDDDEDSENDDSFEVLEDYIDSIWILKVFRSFGWTLPFILVSTLLATGPKAFLMALALPLGQSTFSFAIQRMWGGKGNRPKRKTKTKNRSRGWSSRTVKEQRVGSQRNKKAKMGYQSWVPKNDDSTGPVEKDAHISFGGWDELDNGSEFHVGSSSRSGQRVERTQKSSLEKSRLSMGIRKSDTPLLLRLLIALFPFLGSWTKML